MDDERMRKGHLSGSVFLVSFGGLMTLVGSHKGHLAY